MKTLFLICVTMFLHGKLMSQEADSILNILNTRSERDTQRVHLLIDLASHHYHDNLDTSLLLINQAIELAESIDFEKGRGFSHTAKSGYFFQKGSLDSALVYANKGAEILESIGDTRHVLAAYNNMALIYNNMDKPRQAVEIYLKIYSKIEDTEASIQHMAICNNLAVAYGKDEDFSNAEKWFQKVLNYAKEMNHPTGLAYGYNGVAGVLLNTQDYNQAIEYSLKGLEISTEHQMDKTAIEALQNLGKAYQKKGNSIRAIQYYESALELAQGIGSKRNLEVIYKGLFEIYETVGNHQLALDFHKKYHAVRDSIFSEDKVKLIEELEAKYETAELKRIQVQTELEKEQLTKQHELETVKNRQLSQEKELADLKAEKNKNYLVGAILISCFIVLAGILLFLQFRNRKRAELVKLELEETNKRLLVENQYRESELKAIKAQMNPHFMFNALNSIQEYIILNKKDLASDYLGKFADLMRLYLNQSNETLIELEDEMKSLRLYVELEALRQEDMSFTINCEDDFLLEKKVPPMLIQPYVENAIKHGLWHRTDNKELRILFFEETDKLICEIEDTGIGITASKKINAGRKKHSSFSTTATENRLKIIRERHSNTIDIQMQELFDSTNKVSGTRVRIEMPLNLQMT